MPTSNPPIQTAGTEVRPSLIMNTRPKRKAETDAHDHVLRIPERACSSQDHASTLGCPTPPRALPDAPERNSIYAIMRQHCRSRLYVKPIYWTAEHLKLLECEFFPREVPRNEKKQNLPITVGLQVSDDGTAAVKKMDTTRDYAVRAATLLSKPCAMEARVSAVRSILAACGIEALEMHSSLPFHFDRRVINNIQVDGIFASDSAIPSLAYINLDVLHSFRSQYVRRKYQPANGHKRHNSPVARLMQKKINRLKPKNETEDPYMVAALIALAQQQHQIRELLRGDASAGILHDERAVAQPMATSTTAPSGEEESSLVRPIKVHLLAVPGTAARKLHLYTAHIPPAFLGKFDQPYKFSPSEPIAIAHCSLPLRNAKKLPNRLLRALRAPVE